MAAVDLASLQAHWVDIVMLGWLAASMIIGLVRGLVFETLSLIGWCVAYFAAQWLVPTLAPHLPVGTPGSMLNHGVAFVAAFVAVLVCWGLASRLVRLIVRATPLSLPDRLLGAGFGALRGLVLLLALATLIEPTPLARSASWQNSQGASWLNVALRGLKPLLPSEFAGHLPA